MFGHIQFERKEKEKREMYSMNGTGKGKEGVYVEN